MEIHLVSVAQVEVLMSLLHHLPAEGVVETSAIHPAEAELAEAQLVAGIVIAVVPKILQEALSQRRLAVPSRNRLSRISSDTISVIPCSKPLR